MSNAMDKGFGNLQSKFDQFEAPVPEGLWEAVAVGIGAPVQERSNRKWLLWLMLLFVGASVGFGTVYLTDTGVVQPEPSLAEVTDKLTPEEGQGILKAEKVAVSSNEPARPAEEHFAKQKDDYRRANEPVVVNDLSVPGKEEQVLMDEPISREPMDARLSIQDTDPIITTAAVEEINNRIVPELKAIKRPFFDLQSLQLPDYTWTNSPIFDKGGVRLVKPTKWLTRLNFGFQMNYSTINPNPNDDLFVEAKSYDFDLNTDRLGFTAGYDVWYYLNRRLWLKGQLFSNYRRYHIRLSYEEAGDSSPREFRDQLNALSLGMGAGVIYQFNPYDVSKSALDVMISYENALINEFDNTTLLSYPTGLWNLNLGYTFSPSTRGISKWLSRPYLFYGLNRNFGNRAGEVRPFGFGFQFIRHR